MTTFEELAPEMDDLVDAHLGFTLQYRRAADWTDADGNQVPAGQWGTIRGFILTIGGDAYTGLAPLDELDQRLRLKVQMAVIDRPIPSDRVRGSILGAALYSPSSKFDLAGRYWIADLQGAS